MNLPGTSQRLSGTFQTRSSILPQPLPVATTALVTTSNIDHLWDGEWVRTAQSDTERPPLVSKIVAADLAVGSDTDIPQSAFRIVHWRPGEPDVYLAKKIPTYTGEQGFQFLTRIIDHDNTGDYVAGTPLKIALLNFTTMSAKPADMLTGSHAGLVAADFGEEYACICESAVDANGWVHVRYAPGFRRTDA